MATIRKLPSGNFQAVVRLKGMKPLYATFSTNSKAKQWARMIEEDTSLARKLTRDALTPAQLVTVETTNGRHAIAVPTFTDLVAQYMAQYSGRDRGTQGKLDYWVLRFGDKPVIDITEFDVDDGLIDLSRRPGRGSNKTLTGSSLNRYKSTLSAVFIWFNRHPEFKRLQFNNPVRQEHVSTFPENPAKDRFLTEDEQRTLLQSARGGRWDRMYLLVLLALTTGCRKGELLNLTWADIDFMQRTAYLGKTKTGRPRYVPLTPPVIEELMRFRSTPEHKVFHSTVSNIIPRCIKRDWASMLERAGIGHLRFHDLRHTAASNLVRVGRSLFEVATLLGHSSTTMTARDSHLAVNDTRAMVDAVMGQLR
jgi:integrase